MDLSISQISSTEKTTTVNDNIELDNAKSKPADPCKSIHFRCFCRLTV